LKEEKDSIEYETSQQKYAQLIQKYVRGWINRSKYTGLKNASNKLKKSIIIGLSRYEEVYREEKIEKYEKCCCYYSKEL